MGPLRSAKALYSSRWFLIGMIVGGGAWALHVAAISLVPLSVVQVVLSGGVVLIAVMADRLFGFEVGRRQWWVLAFTAVGLVLLLRYRDEFQALGDPGTRWRAVRAFIVLLFFMIWVRATWPRIRYDRLMTHQQAISAARMPVTTSLREL